MCTFVSETTTETNQIFIHMETITFNEILSRLTSNPKVINIDIHRINDHCGCSKPGDIVAVYAKTKTQGIRLALQRVFDEQPTIHVEKFTLIDGERGYTYAEKDYLFAI